MIAKLHQIVDDPETVLALEAEEFALVVLANLAEMESRSDHLNRYNYSQSFRNKTEAVQRAIMEAWAWLESAACLAPRPCVENAFFITRRGKSLLAAPSGLILSREQILPRHILHPVIEQKARSPFLRGDYDSAVFESFKQVEVAIRDAAGLPDSEIGVTLARKAFDSTNGMLTDKSYVLPEREALSHLFAGAIGSYKNPHSHRNVAIKDAAEAAEMVILASHLLKIVDARRPTPTT